MVEASTLLLGLGLGLRHAADVDHVAAVSTLLRRETSPWRAVRTAVLWGLGHSTSFFAIGVVVILAGLQVPPHVERFTEIAVAVMLIALGIAQLRERCAQETGTTRAARPLTIGVLHGLAGSAGVALLATSTIESPLWALAYLAMFGVGTLAGMAVLTAALAWSLAWSGRRGGWIGTVTSYLPGGCSLLVGLGLLADTL
jgi:hypothetical protein